MVTSLKNFHSFQVIIEKERQVLNSLADFKSMYQVLSFWTSIYHETEGEITQVIERKLFIPSFAYLIFSTKCVSIFYQTCSILTIYICICFFKYIKHWKATKEVKNSIYCWEQNGDTETE